ncbi:MAG: FAD-dependent oxidoreductase, partial [Aliifodinibius sp.]|nr:FAD-dependent oxidoreductase [Fodinibius sp.]
MNIHYRTGPHRILGSNNRVQGLEVIDVERVFDEKGRFNPQFLPNTEKIIEADTIIIAIGQQSDLSLLSPETGIETTPRHTIKVDPQTLETTVPGIYAGGDIAFGPRNAIDAVADGQRVARAIDARLNGGQTSQRPIQIQVLDSFTFQQPADYDILPRQPVPTRPIERRVGIAEIE